MQTRRLKLIAPLSGNVHRIQDVPDPVFAQKMAGDGIAIDPTSQVLLAPADGIVQDIHPSKHAITIRTNEGIELLLHIGLDTVVLRGEGFYPQVKAGDRVTTGQPLIDFDADQLALNARSLLTEIVVTNPERVHQFHYSEGLVQANHQTVMELDLDPPSLNEPAQERSAPEISSDPVQVTLSHGLHARPAATLAHRAKLYPAHTTLKANGRQADMKSVVSLISLNIRHADEVQLFTQGQDAERTLEELSAHLRNVVSGTDIVDSSMTLEDREPSLLTEQHQEDGWLRGISASPGMVAGPVFQLVRTHKKYATDGQGISAELEHLIDALSAARLELEALQQTMLKQNAPDRAAIFTAHSELLDDPTLFHEAKRLIYEGRSAAFAWEQSIKAQVAVVSHLDNPILAARANDLADVGKRALNKLLNNNGNELRPPEGSILITDELTPSEAIELERQAIAGICTFHGSETSHVALLARSMGLPAVVGVDEIAAKLPNGQQIILDGIHGRINTKPSTIELEQLQRIATSVQPDGSEPLSGEVQTQDCINITLLANIASAAEASKAARTGSCGVGLLRSEFLYLDRAVEPTVEEQCNTLLEIHEQFQSAECIVVRTLDIGGDKNLPYLPQGHEINPELGLRGIRYGLHHPGILRRQVRAILTAAKDAPLNIMLPMVSSVDEIRLFKRILEQECNHLELPSVPLGIMIELPGAAMKAEQLAAEVDFFSIGSNDLAQYTLAIDRGHAKLAHLLDALDPAVLKLIQRTVLGANVHSIPVSLCGNIAADPLAIPVLLGLGLRQLSFTPALTHTIRLRIQGLNISQCEQLAGHVLTLNSAKAVRNAVTLWQSEQFPA